MVWTPGDMTAAQMEEEWFELNGWTAQPPADVVARWRVLADEEAAHRESMSEAEAASTTQIGHDLPPVMYIPAHPDPGGTSSFAMELMEINGKFAVVGFSSLGELVAQCGDDQPWVALPPSAVATAHQGLPILCDPSPGIVSRVWNSERLSAMVEVMSDV